MNKKVIVYGKPNCVQCNATYRALDTKGIVYETRDLTKDEEMLNHFKEQGHLQAPVVMVESDLWSGFRPDKISEI